MDDFNDVLKILGYPGNKEQWIIDNLIAGLSVGLMLSLLIYLAAYSGKEITTEVIKQFIIFVLSVTIVYIIINYSWQIRKFHKIKSRIEERLPDFLFLVASNLRAGMTPMLALKKAARPEFEPLSTEINYIAAKSLGTGSFFEELLKMAKRMKSELLERIFVIFITGGISGGDLATMLEQIGYDIRETQLLRKKLLMGVNIYILFITISLIIGLPLLLSGVYRMVVTTSSLADISVNTEQLYLVFLCMIGITSILVGVFISVIKGESRAEGLIRGLGFIIITEGLYIILSYLLVSTT